MLRFIFRRLLLLPPILLGVTIITFALTRLIPGNPIDQMVSPMASPELRQRIAEINGLNDPLWRQYLTYVQHLLHGDLGMSFSTSQPVLSDLTSRFAATFEITLYALIVALVLAVPLGVAAAVWRGSWVDQIARILAVIGVAMPVFWLGLLAIYIFFFLLGWLAAPQGRIAPMVAPPIQITGLYVLDALLSGNWAALASSVRSALLPTLVLAFGAMAPLARITRIAMIEALNSDYVRAARALGLSEWSVVTRHAFRNAVLSLFTMLAIIYGNLLGGTVLVENLFAWPGLGRYAFNAITSSDYPAVQGFILYATFIYIAIFLVLDVAYAITDPRVRVA